MVEREPSTERGSVRPNLLRFTLITLLLAGSLWFALRDVQIEEVWNAAIGANVLYVLAVGVIVLLAHLARAVRWRYLIPEGESVPLRDAFSATVVGYFASNVIPRSGELLRPYVLARRIKRPASGLLATVVFERLLDGITLLIILGGILLLAEDELIRLLSGIEQLSDLTPGGLILRMSIPVGLLVVLLILLVFTPVGMKIITLLCKPLPSRFGEKVISFFNRFREGFHSPTGISHLGALLFWTLVIWAGYALSLHAGVLAFDLNTAFGLDFGDSVVILGLTTIGVAIAPTPGGFGIFHTFARATLVLLYGVDVDQAVAFAFTVHFAQYAATMVAGGYFVLREGTKVFARIEPESTT